jgi:hypothetical protein
MSPLVWQQILSRIEPIGLQVYIRLNLYVSNHCYLSAVGPRNVRLSYCEDIMCHILAPTSKRYLELYVVMCFLIAPA